VIERPREGFARGKSDVNSDLGARIGRASRAEEGLVSRVEEAGLKSGRVHFGADVGEVASR